MLDNDKQLNHEEQLQQIPELKEERNILGRWASFFINRSRIVLLIIVAILIWGIVALIQMPRELQPQIILPYGHVYTAYPGAAPEEVETLITDELEKKIDELDKVKLIQSSSGFGISSIFVEFEAGTDTDEMLQKLREKVSAVQSILPSDAEIPVVSSFETNNSPIMVVNISGEYDLATLKNYADKIKNEIEKIKEISDVQIVGGLEREIKIITDPQKLSIYRISPEQIRNAIVSANVNFPGGNIVLDNKNYNVRTVGEIKNTRQLEDVVITYVGNSPLLLKDIAYIEDGYKDAISYSRMSYGIGSEGPAVMQSVSISVKKKQEADVIRTSKKVYQLIEDSQGRLYPDDLQVAISGDLAKYVEEELGSVMNNALSGLYLVIIVLFLFIGFRESMVVSIIIPLAVLSAIGLMYSNDMTLNFITLFSLTLAVGMLIDNGIVIMQNIDRIRSKGLPSNLAAEVATNQIAPAVASSSLTTIAGFGSILLTAGIMGEFIKGIPLTVIYALAASFFLAITITPALCAIAMRKHRSERARETSPFMGIVSKVVSVLAVFMLAMLAFRNDEGLFMGFGTLSIVFGVIFSLLLIVKMIRTRKVQEDLPLAKKYGDLLYVIIKRKAIRWLIVCIATGAFLGSVSLIPLGILKVEMFSTTDQERLYINIEAPKGTRLEATSAIAEEVEKRLLAFSEIKSFVSNVGITGADTYDTFAVDASGTPNQGRITIDLFEPKNRSKTSMEIASEMRKVVADIPGAKIVVEEFTDGPPTGPPILVRVLGENLADLELVTNDLLEILKQTEGARDAKSSAAEGSPELQVRVNKEKAALFGLDDMTIAMGVRNAIHGLKATALKFDQTQVDVVIRKNRDQMASIDDFENMYFYSRFGQPVLFSQVAEVVEGTSITSINHENLKRQMSITSDIVTGVVAGDVLSNFREAIVDYPLPSGITIEFGGEFEDIQETFTDMFINIVIAFIVIFIILTVQFNSLSQPLIILGALPMALIGVMPGLVLTGNNFGFFAFVGLVALIGIVINNGIVLIDYINYLRKNGYELHEAIKETGVARFVPVLATTITTIGGILPVTIKQEYLAQMGYTLIFGLSAATLLTLVLVPVLYCMFEETKLKRLEKKGKQVGGNQGEETTNHIPAH